MADDDLTLDLSDELYDALRLRAETAGRTPDEEARAILVAVLSSSPALPSGPDGSG